MQFNSEFLDNITQLNNDQASVIKINCGHFIKISISKILEKFPILFKTLEFLNPEIALDNKKRNFSKLLNSITNYVSVNTYEPQDEWDNLPISFNEAEKSVLSNYKVADF